MIRYIIVDDEHIAHDIIKEYCDLIPNMELVENCYDAFEAIACLSKKQVDLIFLDLNMPKLKGFDFLKTLSHPPKVIVTTAYQEHAIEGYELNIVDYLLKPFSFERFITAVNKVGIKSTIAETTIDYKEDSFFIRSNRKHIQLNPKEILYVESIGNYCKIITTDDTIKIREKISNLQELLPSDRFCRVHKSFLIGKQHIKIIEGNSIHIADHVIPIGKIYKESVNRLIK